jgi:hypothetical protein
VGNITGWCFEFALYCLIDLYILLSVKVVVKFRNKIFKKVKFTIQNLKQIFTHRPQEIPFGLHAAHRPYVNRVSRYILG